MQSCDGMLHLFATFCSKQSKLQLQQLRLYLANGHLSTAVLLVPGFAASVRLLLALVQPCMQHKLQLAALTDQAVQLCVTCAD